MKICLKFCFIFLLFFTILNIVSNCVKSKVFAATLGTASDTITTSRPSASTPLSADLASGVGSASVYANGSTFLASDSAHLWGQTQETVTIATVSAAKTTLFFTGNTANSHANGTVISTAITALHTVKFITQTTIPINGTIVLQFPSSIATDSNQASPSASAFMFNNLSTTNIKANFSSGTSTCSFAISGTAAGSAPTITCTVATASVAGGVTVTILVGCNTAGTSCAIANQVPTLINPTKTAASGTADIWALKIQTTDASSNILDSTTVRIGTVESVNVVAHIDTTFTMTIAGIADGTSINTASMCTSSHTADTSNTGFATTSQDVNLGTLSSSTINRSIQTITISSNATGGYTLTATSSGHLLNPANGYYLTDAQGSATANDSPAPATIAAGTPAFGIHACDANSKVATGTWGQSPAKFANPSQSFYYTLVNSGSQPASGGDKIVIEYAATPASTTPAGDYHTVLTYVGSIIF